jgi:hypothetical protein
MPKSGAQRQAAYRTRRADEQSDQIVSLKQQIEYQAAEIARLRVELSTAREAASKMASRLRGREIGGKAFPTPRLRTWRAP